jgi:hypothetical protein
MLRLSNIRIGIKLAIMSGLGVLLVAAMMATQMLGSAAVRSSIETAVRQALLTQSALDAKASLRGLQVGVRDIRLARSADDLAKAMTYLHEREASITKSLNEAGQFSRKAETNEKLNAIKASVSQYLAGAKEIAAVKTRQELRNREFQHVA